MTVKRLHKAEATAKALARQRTNEEILELVRKVCEKQGGCSEIGEGFMVVDTTKFEVKEK